jgi:hypothetical protein
VEQKLIGQEVLPLTPKLSTKVQHIRVDREQRWSIGSGLEVGGVGPIDSQSKVLFQDQATPTIFHVVNAFVVARQRLARRRGKTSIGAER